MSLGIRIREDFGEHDDELADFGGQADLAIVSVSVAMHVAAIALLHRSAVGQNDRGPARRAAEIIASRLSRRGDAPLGRLLGRAVAHLGTAKFDPSLRSAAKRATERIRNVPRERLNAILGNEAAAAVIKLGARAYRGGGRLESNDLEALVAHLDDGADLAIGIGSGNVFASELTSDRRTIEVDIEHLPDPRRPLLVRAKDVRRRGPQDTDSVVLVFRAYAGATELRLARTGTESAAVLTLDGVKLRLRIRLSGRTLELGPIPLDEGLADMESAGAAMAELHREIHSDPLLSELVADLYLHAGFGGSPEALRRLLDLAPFIHRHEAVARQFVAQQVPERIQNPITDVVSPLESALRAADQSG
jgi:hypothetical protein